MPEQSQTDEVQPERSPVVDETASDGEMSEVRPIEPTTEQTDAAEAPPSIDALVSELLAPLTEQVRSLNDRAVHREAVIDRLHAENESLKDGRERKLMEPIVSSLVRLIGHMEAALGQASRAEDDTIGLGMLQGFIHEIEDVLDACGMLRARPLEGELFDPQSHQVKGREAVFDEVLHNTVVTVESDGFVERDSGRSFQRAGVIIARYEEPPAAEQVAAGLATDVLASAEDSGNGSAESADDGLLDTEPEPEHEHEQPREQT